MATIDFPNSPTVGDIFTSGSVSYKWTGVAWISNNLATFDWADITGKPATFPPSAHTHPISDVTNLQTQLDGKAATVHTHTLSQITDYTPPVIPEVTFTNTFMLMGA
jgi:hypothetical protein